MTTTILIVMAIEYAVIVYFCLKSYDKPEGYYSKIFTIMIFVLYFTSLLLSVAFSECIVHFFFNAYIIFFYVTAFILVGLVIILSIFRRDKL